MFEFFGQPNDYSDILKRIFFFTFLVGMIGTIIIAFNTPAIWDLAKSFNMEVTIGPLKITKILLVVVPFTIALFSRVFKLHDRISDLLRIRAYFDLKHIIIPLANGINVNVNQLNLGKRSDQKKLMYKIFYKYAGFKDPVIDAQLVRTALDQWGWFWVFIESSAMLILFTVISFITNGWKISLFFLIVTIISSLISFFLMTSCQNAAKREIEAILDDNNRKIEIEKEFNALSN